MRAYISGPMRGHPQFNFPTFDAVAVVLRKVGYEVDNPAEHDRYSQPGIEEWEGFADGDLTHCPLFQEDIAMRWDLRCIIKDEVFVLLPGWISSQGARIERLVAEYTGAKIFFAYQDSNGKWLIRRDQCPKRMGIPSVIK